MKRILVKKQKQIRKQAKYLKKKEWLNFSHSHQHSLWFGDFRAVLTFPCGS